MRWVAPILRTTFQTVSSLRSLDARLRPRIGPEPAHRHSARAEAKSILFITVDQQRFDALGVNGGRVARTPVLDGLAREGLNFRRAYVPNVVCMPSRSSMLTGQYPRTHGVIANGISLPESAPSVAALLRSSGYRTALLGKAHFEPHLDPLLRFRENRMASEGSTGPWRGFDHVELATHGPMVGHHYARWLWKEHPGDVGGFASVLTGAGGGDTGAPEVAHNPIPRGRYHTDWVADRAVAWLSSLEPSDPFFCWVSFPDPHHPFDPPFDEVRKRIDWRDLDLPEGHPRTRSRIEAILSKKPRHWLDWYLGRFRNPEGGPTRFVPSSMTDDQLREVTAMVHVENELIDEAVGRILSSLGGRLSSTDVFYTSDHGDLGGDFGLLFKGPYHVDALMRVPLIWRPSGGASPQTIDEPVSHVDLAPTFCRIAGAGVPSVMEGRPLPRDAGETRERAIVTFDSQFSKVGMHLRTIYRDGHICTVYEPRTYEQGGRFPVYWSIWGFGSRIPTYDGSEGELYDVREDPHQWSNVFDDPSRRSLRDDLVADLREHLPIERTPALEVDAPT